MFERQKSLSDPFPYWDEDEVSESINSNTSSLFDALNEYYEQAYHGDQLDYFLMEYHNLTYAYVKQGQILFHIWKDCLWKQKASSFQGFLKNEFGLRWYQCRNLVNASRIASMLLSNGFNILPTSQYQCKVLQLLENPDLECKEENPQERIIKVWTHVTDNYCQTKITGKIIQEAIALMFPQFIPEKKKVDVFLDVEVANRLSHLAREEQTSINELILNYLDQREEEENETEEVYGISMTDICRESVLFNQLKQLCLSTKIKLNDFLESITKKNIFANIIERHFLVAEILTG